jgi:hypothetical protein
MCRDMPLLAAIRRSLERKLLIFLGLVLSSQAEGRRFAAELRSASASRAKPAREPGLALQGTQASSRRNWLKFSVATRCRSVQDGEGTKEGYHARARSVGIRRLRRDALVRTLSATEGFAALLASRLNHGG